MNHEVAERGRAFEALDVEWRRIADHTREVVAGWEGEISSVTEDEVGLRRRGEWVRGRDDFLGVLGLQRHEVWHSRVIA